LKDRRRSPSFLTYTSWNPVASGTLKGNEGNLAAGYVPFAQTKADRLASGDLACFFR
jgi:hypothetical protein